MALLDTVHDWSAETPTVRDLHELLVSGRLRDLGGLPFPVDPSSRHAGFVPCREDCTRIEALVIRPVQRAVEQPATPFGPARSEFVPVTPPLSIVVARATEYAYDHLGFEWAVCFEVEVGGERLGTFFGNRWGWEFDEGLTAGELPARF